MLVGCLVVFYAPSTARSFRDGTPIYCPCEGRESRFLHRSHRESNPDDDCDVYDNEVCDHDQQLDYFEHSAKRVEGNPTSMRVSAIQSPALNTFYKHHPFN